VRKIKGIPIWWWAIPAVAILGGVGYYWYSHSGQKPENVMLAGDLSPVGEDASSRGTPGAAVPERGAPGAGEASERSAGIKAFPIEERAGGGDSPDLERAPVDRETLLEELRSATEGQIERLSELSKKDFASIDRRLKELVETGGAPVSVAERRETEPVSGPGEEVSPGTGEPVRRLFEPGKERIFAKTPAERLYCGLIDEYVADFFSYLDTRKYIKRLDLQTDTYSYFKRIIKALSARPPEPGGEGLTPTLMVKNIFFFSRALDRRDLRFFKEVVKNERDTLEINMEMFYRWAMLERLCPGSGGTRIPFDVLYRYAGFLLNTTGGRAYLFRRSISLRLLLTYYSLLVVYQADRSGRNSYGINIFPHINPLREEISHYPDFQFQDQYMDALTRIEDYYLRKR